MFSLLRAELVKALKHYKVMSFLVWVYPVGYTAFYIAVIPLSLISESARFGIFGSCPNAWSSDATMVWGVLTSFPSNVFGRMLPLSFMAIMFAGEYEWGTWRNVIPRSPRTRLMISKLIAYPLVVLIAFFVLSVIPVFGQYFGCLVNGFDAIPPFSGESLLGFVKLYAQHTLLGSIVLLFMVVFAAISAMLTRSILGGLLLSLGMSLIDLMSLGALSLFRVLLGIPELLDLYVITPSYNIDNLRSWFLTNHALPSITPSSPLMDFQPTAIGSLAILAAWLILLALLALRIFQRQDITS